MSLFKLVQVRSPRPRHHATPRSAPNIVVAPSDEEVRKVMQRTRVVMKDGPVDVEGQLIGWKKTDAGPLGAIFANPLTNRRELWALDFTTRKPRPLAVL